MVRIVKDLLRRSNGNSCLEYDELEICLIEIESVINARPLNYVGEEIDDPVPITSNKFLNNQPSNCGMPEPKINLMAPNSNSATLVELEKNRKDYVSAICKQFVKDNLLHLDNFHSKGKATRKIRVDEVGVIYDKHTKRQVESRNPKRTDFQPRRAFPFSHIENTER